MREGIHDRGDAEMFVCGYGLYVMADIRCGSGDVNVGGTITIAFLLFLINKSLTVVEAYQVFLRYVHFFSLFEMKYLLRFLSNCDVATK
jgi:hypothetical protein